MKPNIIYIVCHDLGRYLGCYGAPVNTPHLDRLAESGALFRNAFCNSVACSPSRGCAVTGKYAHSNGLMGLVNNGWSLPEEVRTIVDELNDYETVNCGIHHSDYQAILAEMRKQLDAWMKETADPLLDGPFPDRLNEWPT